mgnify:CR=1 FL=1
MWIFTKDGFYSVVQKSNQKGTDLLTVRSRYKSDMAKLIKSLKIPEDMLLKEAGDDYEYRVVVEKSVLADYMKEQVMLIDYSNFTHEIELRNKKGRIFILVYGLNCQGPVRVKINIEPLEFKEI